MDDGIREVGFPRLRFTRFRLHGQRCLAAPLAARARLREDQIGKEFHVVRNQRCGSHVLVASGRAEASNCPGDDGN